ncbi:MAG: hypothetical protein HY904_01045 [Deltaproteobacteria bacterium]|nr:hypothetical protein [Deltaproteobacteria bacterium]
MSTAALLWVTVTLAGAGAEPAAAPTLPPLRNRPIVVVDRIRNAGLLLPSVQETIKAAVIALNSRYGNGSAVMEDELNSLRELRRLSRGMVMNPGADDAQRARIALLEWAVKEAPYRVKATFVFDKKQKAYVAAVECRHKDSPAVIHRAEGAGKSYDAAVTALEPKLRSFCGVLDTAAADRAKAP